MLNINKSLNELILSLYDEYKDELIEVSKKASLYKLNKTCMLPFRTTEILYLLTRFRKPDSIVEFSPHDGWSTFWFLEAIKKNKKGKVFSYDLIPNVSYHLKEDIDNGMLVFTQGDVRFNLTPEKIKDCDFFYIDSLHEELLARWYETEILNKKINTNSLIFIDDIFHEPQGEQNNSEASYIYSYLKANKIPIVNYSKYRNLVGWESLQEKVNLLTQGKQADENGVLTTIGFIL